MLQSFATPRNRAVSILLLLVCGVLAVAAAGLGIADNPPGILSAFLSVVAFVAALVHPWRRARPFWLLAGGSLAALVVLSAAAILSDILAAKVGSSGFWTDVLHVLTRGCMLAAMVCPSALVVGVVGGLVLFVRERLRSKTAA